MTWKVFDRCVCSFGWLVFVCLFVYLPLAVGLSIHTIQVAFSWSFIFLSIQINNVVQIAISVVFNVK